MSTIGFAQLLSFALLFDGDLDQALNENSAQISSQRAYDIRELTYQHLSDCYSEATPGEEGVQPLLGMFFQLFHFSYSVNSG
jgi:hypothetical protein